MRRVTLLMLTAAALIACGDSEMPVPKDPIGADPALVGAVREAWPSPLGPREAEKEREAFLRLLDGQGPGAARAVVAVLAERAARPLAVLHKHPPEHSEIGYPAGTWLARHPTPDLDAVLLEIAADPGSDTGVRRETVVALCREGNEPVLDPLCAIALDAEQEEDVRRWILALLPRLGAPLRERLNDLLYLPFHDLEYVTAAALALVDEPVAPSLLVEGLRRPDRADVPVALLAQAILRTVAGAPSVAPVAEEVMDLHRIGRSISVSGTDDRTDDLRAFKERRERSRHALADAFQQWLTAGPGLPPSPFEKDRRAYLESAQREREALSSFEDVEAAIGEDMDLAAAIFAVLGIAQDEGDVYLGKLDRLARLLAREIGADASEERVMSVLHGRLLRSYRSLPAGREPDGPPSFLDEVLGCQAGNCLGLTTLYLALAERLSLPLHGVGVPRHVFLRWDDGRTRTNYELTAGGVQVADAEYRSLDPTRAVDNESEVHGVFLRNLTKSQVVSYVLVNRASAYATSPRWRPPAKFEIALAVVERALRLDPRNGSAYLCRATVRFQADPLDVRGALDDVRKAISLHPVSFGGRGIAAAIHYSSGDFEAALGWLDSALLLAPEDPGALANRAWCLLRLGEMDRCREEVEAGLARRPGSWQFRRLRIALSIRDGDEVWRKALDEIEPRPDLDPGMHLWVAEELLRSDAERKPDAAAAKEVLARVAYLVEETSNERSIRGLTEGLMLDSATWTIEAQKRRYLELGARSSAILGEEAEASEFRRQLEALGD